MHQEPAVDARQLMHFLERETLGERIADIPDPFRTRLAEFALEHFAILGFLVHAVDADFQAAQGFLE